MMFADHEVAIIEEIVEEESSSVYARKNWCKMGGAGGIGTNEPKVRSSQVNQSQVTLVR